MPVQDRSSPTLSDGVLHIIADGLFLCQLTASPRVRLNESARGISSIMQRPLPQGTQHQFVRYLADLNLVMLPNLRACESRAVTLPPRVIIADRYET